MPKPKENGVGQRCPRCGRPARRLIRCSVCNDRVCVDQCTTDEDSVACKNCVSLGADEAAGLKDAESE
jgi:hypothetical protein